MHQLALRGEEVRNLILGSLPAGIDSLTMEVQTSYLHEVPPGQLQRDILSVG